ncbi:ImmA/IrrE family metallo-endopeptidase [Cohnella sp. JJ-181]|uniref:ImmA/IrrE family metallo-endopeptidase n=1 Tax=Cohnella rhizoplanae TaxID=2974897 RepID=UPI0022FF8C30|nr:ImmA/IrrE family metallo-endopeptidase [Cohnella sp. JJ-181]CAI6072634.1 hypothetical protein COHCIP112018_02354 [Cohnella sp. JJ-181]
MLTPQILSPRFQYAKIAAQSVLVELGNPEPPIDLHPYFKKRGWIVSYEDMGDVDGMTVKVLRPGGVRFVAYISTGDTSVYGGEIIRRRQRFTLGHELGHILMHGKYLLDSEQIPFALPSHVAANMEVEAHWFSSMVLMPNYVFRGITDLLPEQLADRCGVNLTPARKRLRNLSPSIRESLIQSARLDRWPKYDDEDYERCEYIRDRRLDTWDSFEQAFSRSKMVYICPSCSLIHTERIIFGRLCIECHTPIVKVSGI